MPDTFRLDPDPGPLPTRPPPAVGESIRLEVEGLPPRKVIRHSLRNGHSPERPAFLRLRAAAITAMDGRCWTDGPVGCSLVLHAPQLVSPMVDYLGGVMDTLDGSHGFTFTYLPIVFQDDCQVCGSECRFVRDDRTWYEVVFTFLDASVTGWRSVYRA